MEHHGFRILRARDFSRFTPLLIQFECGHLAPKDIDRAVRCLTGNNYRILYGGYQMDTLAIHESFPLERVPAQNVLAMPAPGL